MNSETTPKPPATVVVRNVRRVMPFVIVVYSWLVKLKKAYNIVQLKNIPNIVFRFETVISDVTENGITAEMTRGETATRNFGFDGRRDNKVAVSPSRPLICWVRSNIRKTSRLSF